MGSAGTGKGAPATCSVYARAQGSVSELLAAPGALSPQDAIAVIRAVRPSLVWTLGPSTRSNLFVLGFIRKPLKLKGRKP